MTNNSSVESNSISARFHFSYLKEQSNFFMNMDLTVPANGLTAIMGKSGSGKTTLLRCIAGLEKIRNAEIIFKGDVWQNHKKKIPTHKRPLAYVFQESSLFPHLTVKKNLDYAIKRSIRFFDKEYYEQILDLLDIQPLLTKSIQTLSGGERQRVAIARAVLSRAKLLLMDEPLSSLDNQRKQEILPYLVKLKNESDVPILYVSHSVEEVAKLADHVVMLEGGKVTVQGDVKTIFSAVDLPIQLDHETGSVLSGYIVDVDEQWHLAKISTTGGEVVIPYQSPILNYQKDQAVRLRVLARDISLTLEPNPNSSILNVLKTQVDHIQYDSNSPVSKIRLAFGDDYLLANITSKSVHDLNLKKGSWVWAQIKSVAVI